MKIFIFLFPVHTEKLNVAKEFFDSRETQIFYNFLVAFKLPAILDHHSLKSSLNLWRRIQEHVIREQEDLKVDVQKCRKDA